MPGDDLLFCSESVGQTINEGFLEEKAPGQEPG